MKKHRKILGAVSAMAVLLSCMTAVLPLGAAAATEDDIYNAAKAYVDANQNNVTKDGLLEAVKAVEPDATIAADADFYIKYAVPGVTDDDTESGYQLNIPGSDGAVAARFTVGSETYDFVTAFAHEKEVLSIENVAIAGADDGKLVYDDKKNVIGYSEGTSIDKIVFPKGYTGTMGKVDFATYPDMAKVEVVIFEDDSEAQKLGNHLPADAFDASWESLVAISYNADISFAWNDVNTGRMPNRAIHDVPNLKYLRLPMSWNDQDGGNAPKAIADGFGQNLPKLENMNVPLYAWHGTGCYNNTGLREIVRGGYDSGTGRWTAFGGSGCFSNDAGQGPANRNFTESNTVPSYTYVIAMAAAAINEQVNLGATDDLIDNAKTTLVSRAWSADSQATLQAVEITMDDGWTGGDAADQGTFNIKTGDVTMALTLSRTKTFESLSASGYELVPAFTPNTTEYTVTVPNNITSIDFQYTLGLGANNVVVEGNTELLLGANTVTVKVDTLEGKTVTYTFTVIRSEDPFLIQENEIYKAAKAYVDATQNEATQEGLLAAVQAVEPTATIAEGNFYIKHAVPGVTDNDETSDYPLNIPGSDGAVAARITVGEETIDFVRAFAHEKEVIDIENAVVVSTDNDAFTFDENGDVTGYTGDADKLIFPSDMVGTLAADANIPNKDGIKVVIFGNKNTAADTRAHMPADGALTGWQGLIAVDFMGGAEFRWATAEATPHSGTAWLNDCPNLKYLYMPKSFDTNSSSKSNFSQLPSLENTNVTMNLPWPEGSFNGTAVREFILSIESGGATIGVHDPINLDTTFASPSFTAGTCNIITSSTQLTFTQAIAWTAAALNEQIAAGKTDTLIADTKAALSSRAWSVDSKALLDAVAISIESDWQGNDIADQAAFTITAMGDSMEAVMDRTKTLNSMSVAGYTMTPVFNPSTTEYAVTVPSTVNAITVNYQAAAGATVTVAGNTDMTETENEVTVTVQTAGGVQVVYTITVTREQPYTMDDVIEMVQEAAAAFEASNTTQHGVFETALRNVISMTGYTLRVEDFYVYQSIGGAEDDDGVIVPGHKGVLAAVVSLSVGDETSRFGVTCDIEPAMKKYTFTEDEISTADDFILSSDGTVLDWYIGDAKKVVIPDGVEVLEQGWFDGEANNVQVLIIPDSVTEVVGDGMCRHLPHLEAVYLGDGMTEVPSMAFTEDYMLQYVRLSENTRTIGNQAFRKCLLLSSIYIPASVETFNNSCFDQAGIRNITFSGNVQNIYNATIAYPARGSSDNEWLMNDASNWEGNENDPTIVNDLMKSFMDLNPNIVILNPDVHTETPFASNDTQVTGTVVQVHAPEALSGMDQDKNSQYYFDLDMGLAEAAARVKAAINDLYLTDDMTADDVLETLAAFYYTTSDMELTWAEAFEMAEENATGTVSLALDGVAFEFAVDAEVQTAGGNGGNGGNTGNGDNGDNGGDIPVTGVASGAAAAAVLMLAAAAVIIPTAKRRKSR